MMGYGMCRHCGGVYKIIFGALLLLNGFVWPRWQGIDGWVLWLAVLMVIAGVIKLVVPNKCPNCRALCGPEPTAGKRKK